MNKKGIDTRAVNILISIIIITMALAALHIWLRMETVTKQQSTMVGVAGTSEVQTLLAEFVNGNRRMFNEPEKGKVAGTEYTPPQQSDLEIALQRWYLVNGWEAYASCRASDKIDCYLTVQKRSPQFSTNYQRLVILPTADGIKEINFHGTIQQ